MEFILGIILVLGLIIGVAMIVFKLFFMMVSWFVRDRVPKPSNSEACPRCRTNLRQGTRECAVCFWPKPLVQSDRSAAVINALKQQLWRYEQLQLLRPAQVRELAERLMEPLQVEPSKSQPLVVAELAAEASPPTVSVAPTPVVENPAPAADDEALPNWPRATPDRATEARVLHPKSDPFRLAIPADLASSPAPPNESLAPETSPSKPDVAERARRFAANQAAASEESPLAAPAPNAPWYFAETEQVLAGEKPPAKVPAPNATWLTPELQEAFGVAAPRQTSSPDSARVPIARPPVEHTPISKLLSAFLEEKNIRWGELIGGLLIICCSIALVISFWAQINERPLFKFSLFNGVTAAIFAMGFYTERRWKIRTTSLGLLLIGALLTPLNFLAIAAYTDAMPLTDLIGLGGEAVSLVLFSTLVFYAARELAPGFAISTTIGLILPCLWQLLTRRFVDDTASTVQIYLFAGVPLASYLVGMAIPLDRWARAARWSERRAHRAFRLWLILTAATAIPWALLLYKTGTPQSTMQLLAPLLVIAGLPSLAIGILSFKKITAPTLLKLRITGMSLGLLGAAGMLGAVLLAWPAVASLLPVLLVVVTVFALAAWRLKLPGAYVPAGLGAMAVGLIVGGLWRGELLWSDHSAPLLLTTTLSMTGGITLAVMSLGFLALAMLWQRAQRLAEAHWFARLGQFAAAAGFALAAYWGAARIGDPEHAAWVFAVYTVGLVVAAWFSQRLVYGWLASAVLLLTLVQAFVFRWADQALPAPWLSALLMHATLLAVVAVTLKFIANTKSARWQPLLLASSHITSLMAAIAMFYEVRNLAWSDSALFTGWIAVVWLLLGVAYAHSALLTAFQFALALSAALGVTSWVSQADWYLTAKRPWLDPYFLCAQALSIAGLGLGWTLFAAALDWLSRRYPQKPLAPGEVAPLPAPGIIQQVGRDSLAAWQQAQPGVFARVCSWLATGGLLLLALIAVVPGIMQELSPATGSPPFIRAALTVPPASTFAQPGIPHEHAAGAMTVLLLALVIVTLVVRWVHCREVWQLLGLLLCLGCGVLLLATNWEPEVATASAVRWLMSGLVLTGSLALWGQGAITRGLARVGLHTNSTAPPEATAVLIRRMLLGMAAVTYLGLLGATANGFQLPRLAGGMIDVSSIVGIISFLIVGGMLLSWWIFVPDTTKESSQRNANRLTTGITLGISGLVLFGLAVWGSYAALSLAQRPLLGPEPGSWFFALGNSLSYGVPLLMLASALFSFGWRERFEPLLYAAQLLLNVLFSAVYMIQRIELGGTLDAEAVIQLSYGNALLSALMSIAWLTLRAAWKRTLPANEAGVAARVTELMLSQVLLATVLLWLPLGPAILNIIAQPGGPFWSAAAGSWWAWGAGAAVLAANVLSLPRSFVRSSAFYGAAVTTLAALIPLSLIPWDRGDWLVYHVLAAGIAAAATAVLAMETWFRWRGQRAALPWRRWAGCLILLTVGLGLRALFGDPSAPWWTVGLWLGAAMQLAWVAGLTVERGPMWVVPWLVNAAASLAWIGNNSLRSPETLLELLWVNVLAGTVSMAISLALELWCFAKSHGLPVRDEAGAGSPRYEESRTGSPRYEETRVGGPRYLPLHQVLAWLGMAALGTTTYFTINADLAQVPLDTPKWLPAAALAALLVATFACLWDAAMKQTVAMLYCLGLVAAGMFVDALDTQGQLFILTGTVALAAYSLATSYLWSIRVGLRKTAAAWKMPVQDATSSAGYFVESGQGWLVTANGLLSVIVTALVYWSVFNLEENAWRLICVNAILAQTIAIALLARGAVRSALQYATLGMGVLFVMAWGFALLPLDVAASLLHRTVTAAVAISLTVPIYGLGIVKILRTENEWTRAAQKLLPLLAGLAAALFLVVLGIEAWQFWHTGSAEILWPALVAVALALILLAVAALAAAVLPGRDPLQLSERGKTAYVYAAEALLGLLFLHIRVSLPWLFGGWFGQFWPLIVMAIAFIGIGFSEFCRRRRLMVLAEPLERTAALLPLLPVLGMWVLPSPVHGSFVLLSVGTLYLVLGTLRKSLLFTGLALLAVNGSLWVYLQGFPGFEIYRHPQLWIIPPTLCVLIAAQMNRTRMTEEQQTSLRYGAAIVLYGSSCADVFINGVAIEPWLPLVLAALSIAGVFAGILLRVRAFLYLGTTFLIVALFTMIWHAAVEQDRTWIWWVCGIVTGILIIALFGLFEKKRDEMLRLVEKLKQWEA
jgi:hypothetical protein